MFQAQRAEMGAKFATHGGSPGLAAAPERAAPEASGSFLRHRWWIGAGALLGLVAAIVFLAVVTPRFTAQSQLFVNPNDLRVVDNSVTATSMPSDANLAEVESQARVLVSEKVLSRVAEQQDLASDPEFAPPPSFVSLLVGDLTKMLGFAPAPPDDPAPVRALRALQRKVDARREERTYVVDLSVTTAEAAKSVRLAKAIIQAYLAAQGEARTAAAQRATGDLSSRLSDLQARVREADDRVQAYKAQNNIVNAGTSLISDQQLAETSNQLVAARARAAAAKSRYDQIRRLLDTHADPGAIAEAVQSPTISGLRLQYAEIVRRQAELNAQLGGRHPAVIDNAAQVGRMRQLIEAEVRRLAQAAHGDYERALADQAALARNLDAEKARSVATGQALVHLRELEREAEASRLVYQTFLNRSRETSQQEEINAANVRVISEATLPEKSYPPRAAFVLLFGILLGAAAGAGLGLAPSLLGRRETVPREVGMVGAA